MSEQNQMLKSSIIQFRQDFQKQAKKFKVASNEPSNDELKLRISALEKELKMLHQSKSEYESQIKDLVKYRDRWMKLKDSAAKKKRESLNFDSMNSNRMLESNPSLTTHIIGTPSINNELGTNHSQPKILRQMHEPPVEESRYGSVLPVSPSEESGSLIGSSAMFFSTTSFPPK
jgi:cell division protein FtsB